MIPLRDINPTSTRPVVTYALIAINVLVFAFQFSLEAGEAQAFVQQHGLVSSQLLRRGFVTLFTSMFLHGGVLHLVLNMWSLAIFGDNVEDRLGKLRYLLFYIASGLLAGLAQYMVDPHSQVPMVGASGAIAGVLAGYFRLFPRARIVTLVLFFVREVPAAFFIVFWFVLQLLGGLGSLGGATAGGVAVFAHIGGFLAGLWLVHGLMPRRNPTSGFRNPAQSHG